MGPEQGSNKGGDLPGCRTPPRYQNFKKNADFVDTIIFNILCDLPFSINQSLKLADD